MSNESTSRAQTEIDDIASAIAQAEHERGYTRLDVWPDGSLSVLESVTRDERSILPDNLRDPHNPNIQAVHTLAIVGTGSIDCNCDACAAGCSGVDCLGDDDVAAMQERLHAALAEIPASYWGAAADSEVSNG